MAEDLVDGKSKLVLEMAWHRHLTSHMASVGHKDDTNKNILEQEPSDCPSKNLYVTLKGFIVNHPRKTCFNV